MQHIAITGSCQDQIAAGLGQLELRGFLLILGFHPEPAARRCYSHGTFATDHGAYPNRTSGPPSVSRAAQLASRRATIEHSARRHVLDDLETFCEHYIRPLSGWSMAR